MCELHTAQPLRWHRRPMRTAKILTLVAAALFVSACGNTSTSTSDEETRSDTAPLYAASTKLWPSPYIPVCFELPGYAYEKGLIRTAVEATWQASSAVTFYGWGDCGQNPPRGIRITFADAQGVTRYLGRDLEAVPGGMQMNIWYQAWGRNFLDQGYTREQMIQWTAVHEFGHALGFVHEQDRWDRYGTEDWEVTCLNDPANHMPQHGGDRTLGGYDRDSVMNYCSPRLMNWGQLSSGDITGIQLLYGSR